MAQQVVTDSVLARCVAEWEIDVVVDWHLRNSPGFLRQLMSLLSTRLTLPPQEEPAKLVDVILHRETGFGAACGENDIRCIARIGDFSVVLLIETKIGAAFTERQPERYKERCEQENAAHLNGKTICILLAPQSYLKSARVGSFDACVSMEELGSILRAQITSPDLAEIVADYRRIVATACVQQYSQSRDPIVGDFWDQYRRLVAMRFKRLQIKTKSGSSRWSKDVYFLEACPRWQVKHRLDKKDARVVIELLGWGRLLGEVTKTLSSVIEPDMIIGAPPHGRTKGGEPKSIQVWVNSPPVDTLGSFEEQLTSLVEGLVQVERLQAWCRRHSAALLRLNARYESDRSQMNRIQS